MRCLTFIVLGAFAFSAANAQATSMALDGHWIVQSADSVVGYRAHESVIGVGVPYDVVGRTSVILGSMRIDGGAIISASFYVDMRTLKSDDPTRDNDLNSRQGPVWDKHPQGTFTLSRQVRLAGIARLKPFRAVAHGLLKLRGRIVAIMMPLQILWSGSAIQILGKTGLKMRSFGFSPPSREGLATVSDAFTLEVKLTFVRHA